jgi:hypothetical protein
MIYYNENAADYADRSSIRAALLTRARLSSRVYLHLPWHRSSSLSFSSERRCIYRCVDTSEVAFILILVLLHLLCLIIRRPTFSPTHVSDLRGFSFGAAYTHCLAAIYNFHLAALYFIRLFYKRKNKMKKQKRKNGNLKTHEPVITGTSTNKEKSATSSGLPGGGGGFTMPSAQRAL